MLIQIVVYILAMIALMRLLPYIGVDKQAFPAKKKGVKELSEELEDANGIIKDLKADRERIKLMMRHRFMCELHGRHREADEIRNKINAENYANLLIELGVAGSREELKNMQFKEVEEELKKIIKKIKC